MCIWQPRPSKAGTGEATARTPCSTRTLPLQKDLDYDMPARTQKPSSESRLFSKRSSPSINPQFCEGCSEIFLPGSFSQCRYLSSHGYGPPRTRRQEWDPSFEATCWLCRFASSKAQYHDYCIEEREDGSGFTLDISSFSFRGQDDGMGSELAWHKSRSFEIFDVSHQGLFSEPLLQAAASAQRATNTGDPDMLDLVSVWLKACSETHVKCRRQWQDPLYRPTRLLEVSQSSVKLVRSADSQKSFRYATLSHCWGKPGPAFLLTTDTLLELYSGVPISRFDATFRDAFRVTRHLGLHYIWIDCYCIIQGSDNVSRTDWAQEATEMDQVYMNSTVNIGATHGRDARNGCFASRNPKTIPYIRLNWEPRSTKYGRPTMIRPFEIRLMDKGDDRESRSMGSHGGQLFKRGWVVQERVLPVRAVYFAENGLWWQCPTLSHASDASPLGIPSAPSLSQFPVRDPAHPMPFGQWRSQVLRSYCSAFEEYSRCKLTKPDTDQVIAFSGVGNLVARAISDRYSNGFLHSSMPYALCWNPRSLGRGEPAVRSGQRSHWPSWHWASHIDSELHFCSESTWSSPRKEDTYHAALATILSSQGELAATLRRGTNLTCLGRLVPAHRVAAYYSRSTDDPGCGPPGPQTKFE